jgi:hypothetical protein
MSPQRRGETFDEYVDRLEHPTPAQALVRDVRREVDREWRTKLTPADAHSERIAPGRAAADAIRAERVSKLREPYVYRPQSGHNYLQDLVAAHTREDADAIARLKRNNAEYRTLLKAAGLTQAATAGGEFNPPTWYVAQAAPFLRAGRPFLNALGTKPLPLKPGSNQLDFPKLTTGASVAVQTDTNTTSNTDWVTTSLTAQLQTSAGRTVASNQYLDLSREGAAQTFQDLIYACNNALDRDILAASNVTNAKSLLNTASVNSITYTDASPTGPEFYAPVTQAAAAIGKNAGANPSFGVTHPSIWWAIAGSLDGNTRPLIEATGAATEDVDLAVASHLNDASQMAAGDVGGVTGIVGSIAGIPICSDANIPTNLGAGTNESRIVVLNRAGFDVYETPPVFKVADQSGPSTLQTSIICIAYWCVVPRQPKMISVISGSGCIPTSGY